MDTLEQRINYLTHLEVSTKSHFLWIFLQSILIITYAVGSIKILWFAYSWLSSVPWELSNLEIIWAMLMIFFMLWLLADWIWFCIQQINIPKNLKRYSVLLYEEYKKTIIYDEDLNAIFSLAKSIKKQTQFLIRLLEFNIIFSEIWKIKLKELLSLVLHISNQIITDLRSDLATRLTEQQQILECAKSEVEHNITGTPELLAVSEAQQVRLDRQIVQFEELQRVLVRV